MTDCPKCRTSELRKQLMNRIDKMLTEGSDGYAAIGYGDMLETVAAECIRQMEWARTLRGERWEGDARDGTRYLVDLDEEPLSIAPEDWRPS